MDKILLIDFHNAMWRASISFSPKKIDALSSPLAEDDVWTMRGDPAPPTTSKKEIDESFVLIFNFFRNLRPIIEKFTPDKCFMVEEGHPQFRYDLFSDYKANRIIKRAASQEKQEKVSNHLIGGKLNKNLPLHVSKE